MMNSTWTFSCLICRAPRQDACEHSQHLDGPNNERGRIAWCHTRLRTRNITSNKVITPSSLLICIYRLLRLRPTARGKRFFASRSALCALGSSSNSHSKQEMHFAFEAYRDANMLLLSPPTQIECASSLSPSSSPPLVASPRPSSLPPSLSPLLPPRCHTLKLLDFRMWLKRKIKKQFYHNFKIFPTFILFTGNLV